jgi:hypothetical protein
MPFKSKKQRKWMHANKPEMAKKWEKKYVKGGKTNGPSHKKGGIPIEVEGGEYIIKKSSVNKSTESYLDYINNHGKLPSSIDARKRRK